MKPNLIFAFFAIAAVATPVEVDTNEAQHIRRRDAEPILATVISLAILFGGFIWGGRIIGRKTVDYYFQQKEEREGSEQEKPLNNMVTKIFVGKSEAQSVAEEE